MHKILSTFPSSGKTLMSLYYCVIQETIEEYLISLVGNVLVETSAPGGEDHCTAGGIFTLFS